jgi:sugar/nucleoside kinase (ribokinase family)
MSIAASLRSARICVVGNINRDIRTSALPSCSDLHADGETAAEVLVETIGGGGALSAIAAAGFGAQVSLVGRIGDDALGGRLEELVRSRGVRPRLVRSADAPTGTSLALTFQSGARHFVSCLPSSRQLGPMDIPADLLDGQHHLLRADVWFSEAMLYQGNRQLFERARQAGVETSLDLNWDPGWGTISGQERARRIAAVRDLLPLTVLAHGNARELCAFTDESGLELALARLEQWGCAGVVVHLGRQGSGFWQQGTLIQVPPGSPARIRHTAGTGDLLSMVMMALHRSGLPMRERLRYANEMVARYMEGEAFQPADLEAVGVP